MGLQNKLGVKHKYNKARGFLCKKIGWIGYLDKEQGLNCKRVLLILSTHKGTNWFANIAKLRG
jgi:hypothetical protein